MVWIVTGIAAILATPFVILVAFALRLAGIRNQQQEQFEREQKDTR